MDSISDNTIFFTLAVILVILFGMNQDKNGSDTEVIIDPYMVSQDRTKTNEQKTNSRSVMNKVLNHKKAVALLKNNLVRSSTNDNTDCAPLASPSWNLYNTSAYESNNNCSNVSASNYRKNIFECISHVGDLEACMQKKCSLK